MFLFEWRKQIPLKRRMNLLLSCPMDEMRYSCIEYLVLISLCSPESLDNNLTDVKCISGMTSNISLTSFGSLKYRKIIWNFNLPNAKRDGMHFRHKKVRKWVKVTYAHVIFEVYRGSLILSYSHSSFSLPRDEFSVFPNPSPRRSRRSEVPSR